MANPTLKQLLTNLGNFLFKGGILSKVIEVAASIVIAELVNQLFQGIKNLPASQAIGNLSVDISVFTDELSGIEALGGISNDELTDLTDLYNSAAKLSPLFYTLYPVVYTTQRLKQITDLITGNIYQVYAKKYRPIPAPPNSVLQGAASGGPYSNEIRDVLARNGISDSDIDLMFATNEKKLPEEIIIANIHNGVLTDDEAHTQLEALGYSSQSAELFLKAGSNTPDIVTLISLAQSNVFDDSDAATFGVDHEKPAIWDSLIRDAGYESDIATYSWRARYNMPPLSLFYQAVRLGLLNQDERNIYYKAIGIPPGIYDIMDAAITTPISPGYAIQAFQSNVIDEGTFKEILIKNGAGKVEQDILIKLAKSQTNPQASSNTVTQIRYAISDGFITDQQAIAMLESLGLTPDQAQMQVTLAHYDAEYSRNKSTITKIKDGFTKGEINADVAQSDLIHIGINSQSAQQYVSNWVIEAQVNNKIPSITDYTDMWKYGIIKDISVLISGIIRNGYNHADATNLAALILARTGVTNE